MPEACQEGGNVSQSRARNSFIKYIAAIVLGMNDALVELTGALAGFTIALPNNRLIALAGFTTGIAATLSMASAEFLSQEAAVKGRAPWKMALATGIAYLITVALLLLPYFLLSEPLPALGLCLLIAALIILAFTWVFSRVRKSDFKRDFLRMLSISFSVAGIAFAISWAAKIWWGIEI